MTILDRLKAQPELMEALGVDPDMGDDAYIGNYDVQFDNDDCPGSALLLVRCMAYLEGKCGFADLGPQSDEHEGALLPGYCARGFDKRGAIAAEGTGKTKLEAALLAVLEVAEGK